MCLVSQNIFRSIFNDIIDICKSILVGIILWVPDSALENPCSLKRHLAAISLVLSWAEMITLVARHPRLAQYNIYVTMFYRVLRTFTLFLVSLQMSVCLK